jgi:type VI secretion system protein ImpE
MNAVQDRLRAGELNEAITALNDEVKKNPGDINRRAQLAELLCFAGNLERADTILDSISSLDPAAAMGVALFRQLVRAEQARQQFFSEGRVPEFLKRPEGSPLPRTLRTTRKSSG